MDASAGQQTLELTAACLKAAADPLRLAILRVLARGSYGVLELSRIFETRQSGMSHHLKVLANGGLVATRREGNSIYYRRAHRPADDPLQGTQSALYATLDAVPLDAGVQRRLSDIQRERAQASQQFFADNADKFREQQDLIASYPIYGEHVADMLARIPRRRFEAVLEIGPGEGEFLRVLSESYRQVFAVDNSPRMLERARRFAAGEGLANVEFLLGDSRLAVDQGLNVDCVVINMVLHHTPSPGDIFCDASQVLQPGGSLVVTDLCRHDQHWASDSCGDLWLGFEPQDFSEWAADAGLEEGQSSYFALRNGFQIQIRHFYKQEHNNHG
ncbi:ArsR/SmtB family transcription factor [Gilvimarinus sp. F26214L]|uniref:ArsR/SmtB family transcription factor n=1 Tax=Gilvimarinus sp. DZF01 TaxID=3461371 RepID=UPI004046577E